MGVATDSNTTGGAWYVVQCTRLKEFYVATALRERLGVDTYLPTVVSRLRGMLREIPFFPGYLFVHVGVDDGALSRINSIPGVVHMVTFAGQRLPVPDVVISTIRERLAALNAQGGLPGHNFHPGDTVSLKSGPLAGLQAIFVGPTTPSARVKILLDLLGRPNEVLVPVESLMTIRDPSVPKPPRRTRGHGRPIRPTAHGCRSSLTLLKH